MEATRRGRRREARSLVSALALQHEYGRAAAESMFASCGLERVDGYRALREPERCGFLHRSERHGVIVTVDGRMVAGL